MTYDFYPTSGAEMFEKARLWDRFKTKFRDDKLSGMLREIIGGDTLFGSEKPQTLLMIVLRNATVQKMDSIEHIDDPFISPAFLPGQRRGLPGGHQPLPP
jgi:hypothetical protein